MLPANGSSSSGVLPIATGAVAPVPSVNPAPVSHNTPLTYSLVLDAVATMAMCSHVFSGGACQNKMNDCCEVRNKRPLPVYMTTPKRMLENALELRLLKIALQSARLVGRIHASNVNGTCVTSSVLGRVTLSFTPSNTSALPLCPLLQSGWFTSVPLKPCPEASAVIDPCAS